MAFSPSYQSEALAFFAFAVLGVIGFSIAFICETLVLWRTRWSRFRPAAAISFMMNLATFFIGICIAVILVISDAYIRNEEVFLTLLPVFMIFVDSLTMLFIARLLKWPHTPSNTVGIAIGANAVSMIVMLFFLSIGY